MMRLENYRPKGTITGLYQIALNRAIRYVTRISIFVL